MIKIERADLRNLTNQDHFQFMTGFSMLIETYKASLMGNETTYAVFKNTLMAEDLAFRIEQGSSAAQILDKLDKLRDKTWNAINMRINATLLSPFEEETESAQFIHHIIHLYGDICSLTYSEQSLVLENVIDDLQLPVMAIHTEKIGISDWIDELNTQNEKFIEVLNAINSEFVGRESTDVKAVRTLIDPVYQQLVERINACIILEFAQAEVLTFAQKLNEQIKQIKIPLAYRTNISKVGEKEDV